MSRSSEAKGVSDAPRQDTLVTGLSDEFHQLEAIRRKELRKKRVAVLATVLCGWFSLTMVAASLKLGTGDSDRWSALGALALIGTLVLCSLFVFGPGARYRAAYKSQVIPALVRSIQPDMAYYSEGNFGQHWFYNSGLYKQEYNVYESEDYLTGYIGETDFQIGEILVQNETTYRSDGETRTSTKTIFDGLLAVAAFPGELQGDVFVIPDFAEKHFGWLGRAFQKLGTDHGEHLLRGENPEFEKAFVVRATDPLEASYILTPEMQKQILTLRTRLGKDLRLAFRGPQVFIAIPSTKDWFEPKFSRPASSPDQVRGLLNQLSACFEIVEDLNLNTRIWTKE
jgi:hypothetical protein